MRPTVEGLTAAATANVRVLHCVALAGGQRYDLIDLARRHEAGAPRTRSVPLHAGDPSIQESPSPEARRLPSDVQSLGDLDVGFAGSGMQHDLSPLDQPGGQRSAAREVLKVVLLFRG